LSLTIHASSIGTQASGFDDDDFGAGPIRETVITQDVPVVVLQAHRVEGIHEPICPEADVNIFLPPLIQLKSVSERFNRLALVNSSSGATTAGNVRLQLSANMHGCLRLGLQTDVLDINSVWDGLQHPQLDLDQMEGGEEAYAQHPTTLMRNKEGEEAWASVRIDGKDWGRVLNVGRLARRVIACEFPGYSLLQTNQTRFLPRSCADPLCLFIQHRQSIGFDRKALSVSIRGILTYFIVLYQLVQCMTSSL